MAMGIVSNNDFDSELDKLSPTKEPVKVHVPIIVPSIQRGRSKGDVAVPDGLRKIIGDESVTNGREAAVSLARDFGISESSVSAYAKGATSTSSYNDRPNEDVIKSAKERISRKARSKLMLSLNKMTPESMEGVKARDLAAIAKDMSAVIRNVEPPPKTEVGPGGPQFIVYSPQFKQENHYEVVQVKE